MSNLEAPLSRRTLGRNTPARSGPELTTPSPATPSPDRLDPPGSQVLTLHPEGPTDRAARAAGTRPGAGLRLLCPKRPFGLHPNPEEGLLGGSVGPAVPASPPWSPTQAPLAPAWGRGPSRVVSTHCIHPSSALSGLTPAPWAHTPLPGLTPPPWAHTLLSGLTPPSLASHPLPGLTPHSLGSHPPPWAHTLLPSFTPPSLASHPTPWARTHLPRLTPNVGSLAQGRYQPPQPQRSES